MVQRTNRRFLIWEIYVTLMEQSSFLCFPIVKQIRVKMPKVKMSAGAKKYRANLNKGNRDRNWTDLETEAFVTPLNETTAT